MGKMLPGRLLQLLPFIRGMRGFKTTSDTTTSKNIRNGGISNTIPPTGITNQDILTEKPYDVTGNVPPCIGYGNPSKDFKDTPLLLETNHSVVPSQSNEPRSNESSSEERSIKSVPPKSSHPKLRESQIPPIQLFELMAIIQNCLLPPSAKEKESTLKKEMGQFFDLYPQKKKGPSTKPYSHLNVLSSIIQISIHELDAMEQRVESNARNKLAEPCKTAQKEIRKLDKKREDSMNRLVEWTTLTKLLPKSLKLLVAKWTSLSALFAEGVTTLYNHIKTKVTEVCGKYSHIISSMGSVAVIAGGLIGAVQITAGVAKMIINHNYNAKKEQILLEKDLNIRKAKKNVLEMENGVLDLNGKISKTIKNKLVELVKDLLSQYKKDYPDYLKSQHPDIKSGKKLFEAARQDLESCINAIRSTLCDVIATELEALPSKD